MIKLMLLQTALHQQQLLWLCLFLEKDYQQWYLYFNMLQHNGTLINQLLKDD